MLLLLQKTEFYIIINYIFMYYERFEDSIENQLVFLILRNYTIIHKIQMN